MSINDLDGIAISDLDYDEVCLNCRWWMVNAEQKMVCIQGRGCTDPDDSCPAFIHQNSLDDDLDAEIAKGQKLNWYYSD